MEKMSEEIRERITEGIKINRLPPKTRNWFVSFANEEFCGDYGMLLKHISDFYIGLIPSGVEHLEQEIEQLKARLGVIESAGLKEEKKPKKRLDGTGGN